MTLAFEQGTRWWQRSPIWNSAISKWPRPNLTTCELQIIAVNITDPWSAQPSSLDISDCRLWFKCSSTQHLSHRIWGWPGPTRGKCTCHQPTEESCLDASNQGLAVRGPEQRFSKCLTIILLDVIPKYRLWNVRFSGCTQVVLWFRKQQYCFYFDSLCLIIHRSNREKRERSKSWSSKEIEHRVGWAPQLGIGLPVYDLM